MGARQLPDQTRLAGIRQAQQPHIGQQDQLQLEIAAFSRTTLGRLAGGTIGAALETGIADPVEPPPRDRQLLSLFQEIAYLLARILIADPGTQGHPHVQVGAAFPGAVTAAAIMAALRLVDATVAKVGQRIQPGIGYQKYLTPIAPVSSVGTASGDKLLTPEADAAVAAVARLDPNVRPRR